MSRDLRDSLPDYVKGISEGFTVLLIQNFTFDSQVTKPGVSRQCKWTFNGFSVGRSTVGSTEQEMDSTYSAQIEFVQMYYITHKAAENSSTAHYRFALFGAHQWAVNEFSGTFFHFKTGKTLGTEKVLRLNDYFYFTYSRKFKSQPTAYTADPLRDDRWQFNAVSQRTVRDKKYILPKDKSEGASEKVMRYYGQEAYPMRYWRKDRSTCRPNIKASADWPKAISTAGVRPEIKLIFACSAHFFTACRKPSAQGDTEISRSQLRQGIRTDENLEEPRDVLAVWKTHCSTLTIHSSDFELDDQLHTALSQTMCERNSHGNHVIINIIDSIISSFNTDVSLRSNHNLFQSLIVKKRMKRDGEEMLSDSVSTIREFRAVYDTEKGDPFSVLPNMEKIRSQCYTKPPHFSSDTIFKISLYILLNGAPHKADENPYSPRLVSLFLGHIRQAMNRKQPSHNFVQPESRLKKVGQKRSLFHSENDCSSLHPDASSIRMKYVKDVTFDSACSSTSMLGLVTNRVLQFECYRAFQDRDELQGVFFVPSIRLTEFILCLHSPIDGSRWLLPACVAQNYGLYGLLQMVRRNRVSRLQQYS
ncbi:hypothetical protein CLF_112312 [Clonorchis sinensis]|uniref:Uncharacterized protein n=1 Tax=Clonorchis sinensis TaxID=79923 RepID=G7YW64_CLOSI|nr:hypothetical protein CLF_112312 [Clonorchis sinensis]